MAFWSRLRQSKRRLYGFSNEFKRFYYINRAPVIANQHISPGTGVPILNNPKFIVQDSQLELFRQLRFFKKGRKSTPKKQTEDWGPRLNEEIDASMVRLVSEEGHDVVPLYKAMALAESLDMDLVEVDKKSDPPVCKIYDYNKKKYLQEAKEKERAKSKDEIKKGPPKEVRFSSKIKDNDLKIKADMAKRLMESNYRVKCMAMDPVEGVDMKSLLSRFCALIRDVAVMETSPQFERTQAYIVVRHAKFGPAKKGPGKKASRDAFASLTEQTAGSDSEHLDEDVQSNESEWAVSDGHDDGHPMFDEQIGLCSPKPAVGTVPTDTASSIPSGTPKPAMENRYARDPKSAKPPGTPPDINRPHGPIQGNQPKVGVPTDMNRRGTIQGNQPRAGMNTPPQMRPNQVEAPGFGASKPDPSRSSTPNSPPKTYGIFSTPKVNTTTPGEQNKPAVSNRYKVNAPSDSARTGPPPQRGPSTADPRMNRGTGFDNQREGRW